jgi:hypothetical protein
MDFNSSYEEEGVSNVQEAIQPVDSEHLEIVVPEFAQGVFSLPQPAYKSIPSWYKAAGGAGDMPPLSKSVRACMPFMEALTFGWVVPVPTDIAVTQTPNGVDVEWRPDFFKAMGNHPKEQVGGEEFPHDGEILKFNLPYTLRTPDGVSTLYMPPLNRVDTPIRPFSGVINTDRYVNQTNIPALLIDSGFEGVIEAGTPLAQLLPFERDGIVNESKTRGPTEEEEEWLQRTPRAVKGVDAYYKEEVWEPAKASRETGECPLGFGDRVE